MKKLWAALLLSISVISCEKPDLVSSDVIPGSDQPGVYFNDTLEVDAFTTADIRLNSEESSFPMFLGSMDDQEIGTTTAAFYIQMLLGTNPPSIPSNAVFTSMSLSLGYSSIYGDSTSTHTFSVYEMAQSLVRDSNYYLTDTFDVVNPASPIGTVTVVPSLKPGVADGGNNAPHLLLSFTEDFGKSFFKKMLDADTADYFKTNESLLSIFKGLYIKSIATQNGTGDVKGSIVSFTSNSSLNYVKVSYKYKTLNANSTDSVTSFGSYSFQLGTSSLRSNRVVHTYKSGLLDDSLQTPSYLYVQSLSGTRLKIKFPEMQQFLNNSDVSINKAELILNVKENSDALIKPHIGFRIYHETEEGLEFIPDYSDISSFPVLNNNSYTVDITRQMQRIVNGSVNSYIYLVSLSKPFDAKRTILNGGNDVKLRLTYTLKQ